MRKRLIPGTKAVTSFRPWGDKTAMDIHKWKSTRGERVWYLLLENMGIRIYTGMLDHNIFVLTPLKGENDSVAFISNQAAHISKYPSEEAILVDTIREACV